MCNSAPEVRHVSRHGFWLLLGNEELLLPFPWFRKATIEQLSDVERPAQNHVYWPKLGVDLSVDSIRNPSAFPLISKDRTTSAQVIGLATPSEQRVALNLG